MSFLAPLFLLGGLAIALPIVFHLIRRTTRERTEFSTLMFLQQTPPRVTKRSRIENWLLLLLRCAVLLLLAFSFARPYLKGILPPEPPADAGRELAILLDTSASMKRGGLWDAATREANRLLAAARPGDTVSLHHFDRDVHTVLTAEEWKKTATDEREPLARQRLAGVQPGWQSTHLGSALLRVAEQFDRNTSDSGAAPAREIVLISDLQEGARLEGLQGYEWPKGVKVSLVPLAARPPGNAGPQWVSEVAGSTESTAPRIRIHNAADSKRDQYQVRWAGAAASDAMDVYVPAGQARTIKPPAMPQGATELVLLGDDAAFDNSVHILPPQPVVLPVLFLGADDPVDSSKSLYYLKRAFQQRQGERIELKQVVPGGALPEWELQAAQLAIIGDAADDASLAAARRFAEGGKSVLIALSSANEATALGKLLQAPAPATTEARVGNFALLGEVDLRHPLFAAFADPRFSDFSKVHFWKHRVLDTAALPGARALAKFDSGDAALVEVPLGKGSVVVWTSSWRPSDSQLALSSKFVPLLFTLLELSSDLPPRKAQYFIGDTVALPSGATANEVLKPDGSKATLAAGESFNQTDLPGVYQVSPGTMKFVVNMSAEESRTAPLEESVLASQGVPLAVSAQSSAADPRLAAENRAVVELEGRQKLWRWLVIGALFIALIESLLAALAMRRPMAEQQPAGA